VRGVEVPDDFERRVLVQLDTDRSGKIDFLEFLAATITIKNELKDQEKILRGVFQLMDVNKVGYISAESLGEICPENSLTQIRGMMKEVCPICDPDRGGYILEWEEFKELMMG